MIRRGPTLPTRRLFARVCGLVILSVALTALYWSTWNDRTASAMTLGIGFLSWGLVMAAFELLKRLEAWGWPFEAPRLRNWLLYVGVIGLAGVLIGAMRGHLYQEIATSQLPAWRMPLEVAISTYTLLLLAFCTERWSLFKQMATRKRAESECLVRSLFESREAWIHARDHRRHELRRLLEARVELELESLHETLSNLQTEACPPRGRLRELRDRVDVLRESEIRHLSHLLHPSIIDVGLLPAMRSLARRFRGRLEVMLEADPEVMDSKSPGLRLTIYRVVELLLENAAESDDAPPIRVRLACSGSEVLLEVHGGVGAFDFARARQDGLLALLEARVALQAGAWEILDGEGVRIRLPAA